MPEANLIDGALLTAGERVLSEEEQREARLALVSLTQDFERTAKNLEEYAEEMSRSNQNNYERYQAQKAQTELLKRKLEDAENGT